MWWNRTPPRNSVAWQRVYPIALYWPQHFFLPSSILYTVVYACIPEIYWFSGSCVIVPVILLPYVVPPSTAAQYAAPPTLAALRRPAGQAFSLRASLRLSYRPIPTSSAPSDIPFVHNITVVKSISAGSVIIPPLIIIKGVVIQTRWFADIKDNNIVIGVSDSGYE